MEIEDKNVVQEVVNDIKSFKSKVEEVIGRMKSEVSGMNDIWRDDQYNQFSEYIEELSKCINRDLSELETANNNLQAKLALY